MRETAIHGLGTERSLPVGKRKMRYSCASRTTARFPEQKKLQMGLQSLPETGRWRLTGSPAACYRLTVEGLRRERSRQAPIENTFFVRRRPRDRDSRRVRAADVLPLSGAKS